jgi:hypothetical protein
MLTAPKEVCMMNPNLVALLSNAHSRQLQASAKPSRALYSNGILERRTAAAMRLLRASSRRELT